MLVNIIIDHNDRYCFKISIVYFKTRRLVIKCPKKAATPIQHVLLIKRLFGC